MPDRLPLAVSQPVPLPPLRACGADALKVRVAALLRELPAPDAVPSATELEATALAEMEGKPAAEGARLVVQLPQGVALPPNPLLALAPPATKELVALAEMVKAAEATANRVA